MTDNGPVCMLCGSRESERYPPKYMNGSLWRCLDCDLRFVYPQPSLEELTDVYSEDYFSSSNSNELGYSDYEGDRSNIYRTFKRRLNYLQQVHPGNGSVLDVGCAYGFFLEVAAEAGWDVSGVDISRHAVERARERLGDRVQAGTFSEEELPEQRFSVITMWDYLEHVVDPKADLAKAWRLLADDGILALATPDVSSMPAKVFGHRWMGYKLDEHLVYFSRATILLRRSRCPRDLQFGECTEPGHWPIRGSRVRWFGSGPCPLSECPPADSALLGRRPRPAPAC